MHSSELETRRDRIQPDLSIYLYSVYIGASKQYTRQRHHTAHTRSAVEASATACKQDPQEVLSLVPAVSSRSHIRHAVAVRCRNSSFPRDLFQGNCHTRTYRTAARAPLILVHTP